MSLTDEMDRGNKARKLLDDPLLTEAWEQVERTITEAWANAPIRDRDGQHELKLMLKALRDVRGWLEQTVTDGKIAAAEFERLNRRETTPAEIRALRKYG